VTKSPTLIAIVAAFAATASAAIAQTPPSGGRTSDKPAEADVCAKLPEADCAAKAGCSWLPGFKVAGGAEVPGYCRPAPRSIKARRPSEQ